MHKAVLPYDIAYSLCEIYHRDCLLRFHDYTIKTTRETGGFDSFPVIDFLVNMHYNVIKKFMQIFLRDPLTLNLTSGL